MLNGYKTYIAAIGLIGLAVYEASLGNFDRAAETFFAALAAFGIRQALSRESTETPAAS